MNKRILMIAGMCIYLLALALMYGSVPGGIQRETVRIKGPNDKPCLATIWKSPAPKAIILLGHGVSANQGVMAGAAKAFAQDGYIAVTFDFWGHGRSRERFDWRSNASQIHAWCDWAHAQFKGLPLAYMGHSMGGFSGAEAFVEKPEVDGFVALGALPGRIPACKTLVAAGRFEELFSSDEARKRTHGKADVAISPYSDHALETWDPILLQRVIAWVDGALGFEPSHTYSWLNWMLPLLAAILGCAASLMLAEQIAGLGRQPASFSIPASADRRWSCNPYRVAGYVLGCRGNGIPPRSGKFFPAMLRAVVFGAVFIVLLQWILNVHIFTSSPNHPSRCMLWLILTPFMALLFLIDTWVLERIPLRGALIRFAVAALTRAVPLLILGIALRFIGHDLAFPGMILGILAFVLAVLSAIHAMATRGTEDYRVGAIASGIVFAWVIAFWFPLTWG